jgi:hypothetical protein
MHQAASVVGSGFFIAEGGGRCIAATCGRVDSLLLVCRVFKLTNEGALDEVPGI